MYGLIHFNALTVCTCCVLLACECTYGMCNGGVRGNDMLCGMMQCSVMVNVVYAMDAMYVIYVE